MISTYCNILLNKQKDTSVWTLSSKIWIYKLLKDFLTQYANFLQEIILILWKKFSGILFAYFIKEDVQNVLLQLAGKPWGTGIIL